jgi:casein kinase 1
VRNLGFEDEPDYNYLRDLFTQALKSTGEAEDGVYDWMKLNDGKGWEAMKAHPSAAHIQQIPNSSQREIHRNKPQIPHDRLNADLPNKPSAGRNAAVHASRTAQRRAADPGYVSDPALAAAKRQSAQDFRHPEGSTVAQFQQSNQNLQARNSGLQNTMQAAAQNGVGATRAIPEEEKPTVWGKVMKIFCCGEYSRIFLCPLHWFGYCCSPASSLASPMFELLSRTLDNPKKMRTHSSQHNQQAIITRTSVVCTSSNLPP